MNLYANSVYCTSYAFLRHKVISKKITWISNYTYDFAIINNNQPYLIELNSFGKEYAAGSALFHWILDEKILYNNSDNNIEGSMTTWASLILFLYFRKSIEYVVEWC